MLSTRCAMRALLPMLGSSSSSTRASGAACTDEGLSGVPMHEHAAVEWGAPLLRLKPLMQGQVQACGPTSATAGMSSSCCCLTEASGLRQICTGGAACVEGMRGKVGVQQEGRRARVLTALQLGMELKLEHPPRCSHTHAQAPTSWLASTIVASMAMVHTCSASPPSSGDDSLPTTTPACTAAGRRRWQRGGGGSGSRLPREQAACRQNAMESEQHNVQQVAALAHLAAAPGWR